jgi:hypothetical protein
MKNALLSLVAASALLSCANQETKDAKVLKVHEGLYAFCGASGAELTGNQIMVQGKVFEEGCAICPVLDGPSISNLAMDGFSPSWGYEFNTERDFQYPNNDGSTVWDGKSVWSLYWYFDTSSFVPQYNPKSQEWEMMHPENRSFIVNTDYPATSESNMFCMPCAIFDTTETGIVLAKCYGPMNEAAIPLRKAISVTSGMKSITAAIEGKPYPVGTPVPVMEMSKKAQAK